MTVVRLGDGGQPLQGGSARLRTEPTMQDDEVPHGGGELPLEEREVITTLGEAERRATCRHRGQHVVQDEVVPRRVHGQLGVEVPLRAAKDARAEAWGVLRHVRCAQLDEAVFERLASDFEARFRVLRLLSRRYFPAATSGKLWDYLSDDLASPPVPRAADGDPDPMTERALEEHLEQHWEETPFGKSGVTLGHSLPCRQVFTPVNAIDLLGFERKTRRWWVFELKRGRSADVVVGQVSRYLGWISEDGQAPQVGLP